MESPFPAGGFDIHQPAIDTDGMRGQRVSSNGGLYSIAQRLAVHSAKSRFQARTEPK
jgi:hypothetical protein